MHCVSANRGIAFKISGAFAISKESSRTKTAFPGDSCRTKNGVKVYTFCIRSPYKPLQKPLIYSRLKIKIVTICTFLTIFLNTYS